MPSDDDLLATQADSEAEAGFFVPGDEIMPEFDESIARMEAQGVPANGVYVGRHFPNHRV